MSKEGPRALADPGPVESTAVEGETLHHESDPPAGPVRANSSTTPAGPIRPDAAARGTSAAPSSRGTHPSFDRLARLAARLLRTPSTFVSLVDPAYVRFHGQAGPPDSLAGRTLVAAGDSLCRAATDSGRPIVVRDARAEGTRGTGWASALPEVVACLGVPLLVEDRVIGVFCGLDRQPRAWDDEDLVSLDELGRSVVTEALSSGRSTRRRRQRGTGSTRPGGGSTRCSPSARSAPGTTTWGPGW